MFGVIWKQSPRYGHLSDNDDDYNDDNSDASHQSSRYPRKARGRLLTISTAVFILSLAVRVGIVFILPQVSTQQCVHDMFLDASIIDDIPYNWVSYGDFFYPHGFGSKSVYRGKASEELELAWSNFTSHTAVAIPEKKLRAMGKAIPERARMATYSDGLTIAAILAGHYQMNCLNLIRQYTYSTDSRYAHLYENHPLLSNQSKSQQPVALRERLDHCIETIRHRLLCTGDIAPYPIWNSNDATQAIRGDFGSDHLCRSWDYFRAWTEFNPMPGVEDPTATRLDLW